MQKKIALTKVPLKAIGDGIWMQLVTIWSMWRGLCQPWLRHGTSSSLGSLAARMQLTVLASVMMVLLTSGLTHGLFAIPNKACSTFCERDMKIVIPGDPIPKARARMFARGKTIQTYDPQHQSKAQVRDWMTQQVRRWFDSENKRIVMDASNLLQVDALWVRLVFTLPHPRNLARSKINAILWGLTNPTSKPDVDNLAKFYLDCANGVLYRDDAQIVTLVARKLYGDKPQTEIEIMPAIPKLPRAAQGILEEFSPKDLKEFIKVSDELANLVLDMDQEDVEVDKEQVARAISAIADGYASTLMRIHKKFPRYHGVGKIEQSSVSA
jgi:Holliday junction resolvase RusA-like endonuclease